ncbi:hypothetical protein J1614_010612 [Plenodomus biglobosus]|nr:hypothetical protein J1614_010612 [Plenodomus biglobosus]
MSMSGESTAAASRDLESSNHVLDEETCSIEDLSISSPDKSPYANAQIVSLEVGPAATRFDVHATILQQSAQLAAKFDPWSLNKVPVPLPDIDEATAHTLIHYLYTGTYQAINSSPHTKATTTKYKLGTCTYCAAQRYQLPGLVHLAREAITSLSPALSIFDILAVAKEHAFPMLPDEESWYPAYIASAIDSAMAEDPEPFRRPDFITRVEGNTRLLQVVWETVMRCYARAPGARGLGDEEVVTPSAVLDGVVGEVSVSEPRPYEDESPTPIEDRILVDQVESSDALENSPRVLHHAHTIDADDMSVPMSMPMPMPTHTDAHHLNATTPPTARPVAPESFTDELGYEHSKTYQFLGKPTGPVTATAVTDPVKPEHTRSDSVVEIEDTVAPLGADGKAGVGCEVVDGMDGGPRVDGAVAEEAMAGMSKKDKKKAKKKKGSVVGSGSEGRWGKL